MKMGQQAVDEQSKYLALKMTADGTQMHFNQLLTEGDELAVKWLAAYLLSTIKYALTKIGYIQPYAEAFFNVSENY